MSDITQFLANHGPSRSSLVAEFLIAQGIKAEAARQRISRTDDKVKRFQTQMLPKREAFLYLQSDENSERFWRNFLRDLRTTNTVYAAAIDGMAARGGLLPIERFSVISGAPSRHMEGQLRADVVATRLIEAGFMDQATLDGKQVYCLKSSIANGAPTDMRARDITERVLLDGLREWSRKIGLASYNSIQIRGEPELKPIGPFAFDLAGPSYLLPLQGGGTKPGFVVADVFAEGMLDVHQIQYFIRKARILKATRSDIGILSIIMAEGFSGDALTAGHAAGIILATPKDLFGKRVGEAIASLCTVLKSAAAHASSDPKKLIYLIDNLFDIQGRNNNLRGALFELVAGYLARRGAVSIDMNVRVKDPNTGKTAEIDVQRVTHQTASVTAIECKGKEPGGTLSRKEIETWLKKIAIIRSYYSSHFSLREAEHRFEIWTSGSIEPDAMTLLEQEKAKRTKSPIDWKDGEAILKLASAGKEKGIVDALNQHFIRHPLSMTAENMGDHDNPATKKKHSDWMNPPEDVPF